MSSTLKIEVVGVPKPGGSKRAFAYFDKRTGKFRAAVTDDSGKPGTDWRGDVKTAALRACHACAWTPPPAGTPIRVHLTLHMPRPKAHFRTDGRLKPNAPEFHVSKPDATKLLRSIEDALTGIAWLDDSQIASQCVVKVYTATNPGASVVIETMGAGLYQDRLAVA